MDNIVAPAGQCDGHEDANQTRTERPPPLRPHGRRRQPCRRAPDLPSRRFPARGGTGSTRRAAAAVHHSQAHRHRFRYSVPEQRITSSTRSRRHRGPESASRAQRAIAGIMPSPISNRSSPRSRSSCGPSGHYAEVDLSARFVDLVGENFDVAIRIGDLRDDASLAPAGWRASGFMRRRRYRATRNA